MDIAIPIHKGTGAELRYTLRGIAKFAKGYDRVILLGPAPDWVQNVEVVVISDITANPYLNHYAKCLYMKEDFILFNDDFFLTKRTDFTQWQNRYQQNLSWRIDQAKSHPDYQQQLMATSRLCSEQLKRHLNFELHCPMIIERIALEWMRGNSYGCYQFRSVSGNFSNKYPKKSDFDVHFANSAVTRKIPDFIDHVNRAGHFSVGSAFMDKEGKDILKKIFPEKCKFEV